MDMDNIENQRVTRFELYGMVAGALLFAALPLLSWYSWGQYHPTLALAWGAPHYFWALPAGMIGAFVGALCGAAIRNFKIK